VCQSLAKRDGFDFEKSYLLWLQHVIGSLAGIEGENRVLVDYDCFMQQPERELTRIAEVLRLPIDVTELQKFQLGFLDPQLQHTIYQLEDLLLDGTSLPLVKEIYSTLLEAATGNAALETSFQRDKLEQWEKEFSRMRPALVFADKLGTQLAEATAQRNALRAERNALSAERNDWLREKAQLTQALKEKERAAENLKSELLIMYQSRSWRWTEPFRKLLSLFKQSR
jgi:hypothetical protein